MSDRLRPGTVKDGGLGLPTSFVLASGRPSWVRTTSTPVAESRTTRKRPYAKPTIGLAGRPVIAKRGGGALETVLDGETGCLWAGGPEELASAVLRFDDAEVDPAACARNALRFDSARFREGMVNQVRAGRATAFPPAGGERQPLASTRLLRRAGREPQT